MVRPDSSTGNDGDLGQWVYLTSTFDRDDFFVESNEDDDNGNKLSTCQPTNTSASTSLSAVAKAATATNALQSQSNHVSCTVIVDITDVSNMFLPAQSILATMSPQSSSNFWACIDATPLLVQTCKALTSRTSLSPLDKGITNGIGHVRAETIKHSLIHGVSSFALTTPRQVSGSHISLSTTAVATCTPVPSLTVNQVECVVILDVSFPPFLTLPRQTVWVPHPAMTLAVAIESTPLSTKSFNGATIVPVRFPMAPNCAPQCANVGLDLPGLDQSNTPTIYPNEKRNEANTRHGIRIDESQHMTHSYKRVPNVSVVSGDSISASALPFDTPPVHRSSLSHSVATAADTSIRNKPCKPMTAYNFFFKDERMNILNGMEQMGDPLPRPVSDFSQPKLELLLHQRWNADPKQARRKHCKMHGKIEFVRLTQVVAQRWQQLSETGRDFYRLVASVDKRYCVERSTFERRTPSCVMRWTDATKPTAKNSQLLP